MENTMKKKVSADYTTASERIKSWTVNIYLLIMLVLYPLFLVNGYMDLVYKKWALFLYATAAALLVSLVWYLPERKKEKKKRKRVKLLWIDWFVLGYLICAVISYATAADRPSALWGVDTWYTGLVAQLLFVGIYFMVSFGYKGMAYLDVAGAAAGIVVGLIIILQRFGVDVLHLYRGFGDDVRMNFVTTLGQVTWTSSYVSILLVVGMGIYFCSQPGKKRTWCGVGIGIGFAAEMVLNCDSGVIALAAAFMILLWLAPGNRDRVMRLMELLMIALGAAALTGIGERLCGDRMVPIDAVYLKAAQSVLLYPLLAMLAAFYLLVRKEKINIVGKRRNILIFRGIYLAIVGAVVIGVIVLFILHGKGYFAGSPTENYFRFTIWWGNSRGFIWRTGAAVFGDFTIWRKLFGCGPDGFTPYAYGLMGDAINEFWHNQLVPNVHNEWFNAVINYGLVGGLAYLGIFVSSAYACIRTALSAENGESAVIFGAGLAAAGYIAHNVLCYQQIIGTPLIFVLMGIGAAKMRLGEEKKNRRQQ